jgi:hypothetical protein
MLVTLADQCDHKLMQYREEEKVEITSLKDEKKKLLDLVSQLKNDRVSLQTQVERVGNHFLIFKVFKLLIVNLFYFSASK